MTSNHPKPSPSHIKSQMTSVFGKFANPIMILIILLMIRVTLNQLDQYQKCMHFKEYDSENSNILDKSDLQGFKEIVMTNIERTKMQCSTQAFYSRS